MGVMLRTEARLLSGAVRAVLFPESQPRPGPPLALEAGGILRISLCKGSTGALETLPPVEPVRARAVLLGM